MAFLVPEAAAYLRHWAHFCGIMSVADAARHFSEPYVGVLAACGFFGNEVHVEVPAPVSWH